MPRLYTNKILWRVWAQLNAEENLVSQRWTDLIVDWDWRYRVEKKIRADWSQFCLVRFLKIEFYSKQRYAVKSKNWLTYWVVCNAKWVQQKSYLTSQKIDLLNQASRVSWNVL